MKPEDVSEEMIYAYAGEPEITATDAHVIADGLARVLTIVERERVASLRLELRSIRREIAEINAVDEEAMRSAALTVLFNHEHEAMSEAK